MQGQNLMANRSGTPMPEQIAELKAEWGRIKAQEPAVPSDHMTVQAQINVIGQDMRQLLEEIVELRARLSPVLAEQDHKHRGRELMPVKCSLAAELGEIHMTVLNAREVVELTVMQLDIN